MPGSLEAPLARALKFTYDDQFHGSAEDYASDSSYILAALRSDPDTLAAMAEALHAIDKRCVHLESCVDGQPVWKQCENWSGRLWDALLGPRESAGGMKP